MAIASQRMAYGEMARVSGVLLVFVLVLIAMSLFSLFLFHRYRKYRPLASRSKVFFVGRILFDLLIGVVLLWMLVVKQLYCVIQ
ncbi:hypothetical protein KIPB_013694, partial [Kipferlia bialata]|eukprot:g13694.t1